MLQNAVDFFCDKQRCIEISRGSRPCGCYRMNQRVGNLALVHAITISKGEEDLFSMVDFSSSRFTDMYLQSHILVVLKSNMLNGTVAFFNAR